MTVCVNGEEVQCHCPTTGRIGDLDLRNVACLVSPSSDPKRRTRYTVEAVSADDPDDPDKRWIGINQVLSNRLVEFFLQTHQLDDVVASCDEIHREVTLGASRLDFLIGSTYLEVKTPLTAIQVPYGDQIRTRPVKPLESTDRFVKHVRELGGSLAEHERAVLLMVYQYEVTKPKKRPASAHAKEVRAAIVDAIEKGVQFFEITMRFNPDGVELKTVAEITDNLDFGG
ncbi:DNA/RNA nuclease SfsA [Propionibacterium acidifaciens]